MRASRLSAVAIVGCLIAVTGFAAEMITVDKEIDDDHIIISRSTGERLLLEKWSLRFSPLSFEGRSFPADISPLWVTVYFEDRAAIKWSIEEQLGGSRVRTSQPSPPFPPSAAGRENTQRLVQAGLTLLGFHGNPSKMASGGTDWDSAIRAFQVENKLPPDGKITAATVAALSLRLYGKYPENQEARALAAALLVGLTEAPVVAVPPSGADIIESRITGEFEGWEGETVFSLDNGQVWQQSSYAYNYHYAYRPKVTIIKSAGGYKMLVDGVTGSINVVRIK